MSKNVEFGISTSCMYPQLMEATIEQYINAGVKNIELFINTDSEMKNNYLNGIKRKLENSESSIVSVHPYTSSFESFLFFTNYERRFLDGMEYYKRYFEITAEFGAKLVVFHGASASYNLEESENQKMYFEQFERLDNEARKFGVILAQENVSNFVSGDKEFIRAMKSELPKTGFVLDIKQAVRRQCDPFEMMKIMGKNLIHVHASDNIIGKDCLMPLTGSFNFRLLVEKLVETTGKTGRLFNITPHIIIELYRSNFFDLKELVESYKHLCKLL